MDGVLGDLGVKSDSTAGKVTSVLSSTASYAATGASVGGPWGAVIGGAIGMASDTPLTANPSRRNESLFSKMNFCLSFKLLPNNSYSFFSFGM